MSFIHYNAEYLKNNLPLNISHILKMSCLGCDSFKSVNGPGLTFLSWFYFYLYALTPNNLTLAGSSLLPHYTWREKIDFWKQLGLNPGPLDSQPTSLIWGNQAELSVFVIK